MCFTFVSIIDFTAVNVNANGLCSKFGSFPIHNPLVRSFVIVQDYIESIVEDVLVKNNASHMFGEMMF